MTDAQTQRTSGLLWLLPGAVLAVAGAVWLWNLAQPRACILIYPPPPGCASMIPEWLPWVGIVLLAVILIAMAVLAVRNAPTRVMVWLLVAMIVVIAVFVAIQYMSFAGVFDYPSPPA